MTKDPESIPLSPASGRATSSAHLLAEFEGRLGEALKPGAAVAAVLELTPDLIAAAVRRRELG